MNALKRQAESGLEVGAKEEKSAFLTYLLSQTELTPTEVVSNCIDLMLAAVDTVPLRVSSCRLFFSFICLFRYCENDTHNKLYFRLTGIVSVLT